MTCPASVIGRTAPGRDAAVFLLFLVAAAAFQFPHYGSFVGDINYDFYLHYNWAKEFSENIALGNPYPRWIFHGRLGLGEPVFMFYAPLYYYAVALLVVLGSSTWVAMQVVAVISTAAFAWFTYRACAYYAEARLAVAIGLTALASPFLVMLNYKFHGLAWGAMGYASHGLLFWALFRPGASRKFINGWAAIAIAVAVGSHIISALVNLVCFSAVALFAEPKSDIPLWLRLGRSCASWGVNVALGLGLSAVYLLPALIDLHLVSPEVWNPVVVFESFAWPVVTPFIYGMQWFSFQWPIPIMALVLALMCLAYFAVHRPLAAPLTMSLAVAVFAVFFASELSFPVWALPTPFRKINLPYRFVSVAYSMGAVAAGLAIADATGAGRRAWRIALCCALGLTFMVGVLTLVKASYFDGIGLPSELASDRYTFERYAEEMRTTGFVGECDRGDAACAQMVRASGSFRGTPEYRLKWAGPNYPAYAKGGLSGECARKLMNCGPQRRAGTGLRWEVTARVPQALILPLFDFPSWVTEVDGERVEHLTDPASGLITVQVPVGTHVIQTRWELSVVERAGLGLSLVTLLSLFVLVVLPRFGSKAVERWNDKGGVAR